MRPPTCRLSEPAGPRLGTAQSSERSGRQRSHRDIRRSLPRRNRPRHTAPVATATRARRYCHRSRRRSHRNVRPVDGTRRSLPQPPTAPGTTACCARYSLPQPPTTPTLRPAQPPATPSPAAPNAPTTTRAEREARTARTPTRKPKADRCEPWRKTPACLPLPPKPSATQPPMPHQQQHTLRPQHFPEAPLA